MFKMYPQALLTSPRRAVSPHFLYRANSYFTSRWFRRIVAKIISEKQGNNR
jgi:hypothetical protein